MQFTRRSTLIGAASLGVAGGLAGNSSNEARSQPISSKGTDIEKVYIEDETRFIKSLSDPAIADVTSDTNGPWEMLLDTIGKLVQGADSFKTVQLATSPRAADWNHPVFGPYRLSKILGDSMPKWGATFQPALGQSFGAQYAIYITNIAIPTANAELQKKLKQAKLDWLDTVSQLSAWLENQGRRWENFDRRQQSLPPQKRKDFDGWYQTIELKFVTAYENDVKSKGQTYASLINQTGGGWSEVANLVNSYSEAAAKYLVPAEGAEDGRKENVYRYLIGSKLDDFVAGAKSNPENKFEYHYDKSTFRRSVSETRWGGSASYGFFIHAGASGGSSHIDWHSADFKMDFRAKGIQTFDVVPGDWYAANLIKMWNVLQFEPDGPVARAIRAGVLWGPNGFFNLRTASLVVVYEPKIFISMSKADYERNASWWSGGGSIGIGPFSFGVSAGGSKEDITFNQSNNSITAVDKSGIPKIVAVATDVLPDLR
jgi:hypothetical protein